MSTARISEIDCGNGRSKYRIHEGIPNGRWWSKGHRWIEPKRENMRRYATYLSRESAARRLPDAQAALDAIHTLTR